VTRRATIVCAGKEATADVARRLAGLAAPGQVLVLEGPLGAGKTTFVHHYRCAPGGRVASIAHADFWRLAHASEVADLGLDDLLEDGAVALVEWGDLFEGELPNDRITISFRVVDDDTRSLTVDATGSSLDDRALAAIAGPEAGQS
jgi:tRNA A37 threonylcarbamoyladenosine biosynthesis protein TsaE